MIVGLYAYTSTPVSTIECSKVKDVRSDKMERISSRVDSRRRRHVPAAAIVSNALDQQSLSTRVSGRCYPLCRRGSATDRAVPPAIEPTGCPKLTPAGQDGRRDTSIYRLVPLAQGHRVNVIVLLYIDQRPAHSVTLVVQPILIVVYTGRCHKCLVRRALASQQIIEAKFILMESLSD